MKGLVNRMLSWENSVAGGGIYLPHQDKNLTFTNGSSNKPRQCLKADNLVLDGVGTVHTLLYKAPIELH